MPTPPVVYLPLQSNCGKRCFEIPTLSKQYGRQYMLLCRLLKVLSVSLYIISEVVSDCEERSVFLMNSSLSISHYPKSYLKCRWCETHLQLHLRTDSSCSQYLLAECYP
uniref:Uncharacterized protein n=1 Tax=Trichobilharzia regenti TaxID=157069 RepID=A0AA85IU08_TRIRE|nr:unnamed protein product [Trichobilharzia regenti]